MKTECIAETMLLAETAESGRFPIRIVIGKPYPVDGGDWACPVCVEGSPWRFPDMHGVDSWQALQLAIQIARRSLENFVEKGGKLWRYDVCVSVEELFGTSSKPKTA